LKGTNSLESQDKGQKNSFLILMSSFNLTAQFRRYCG
jgi:hypothetical protein